MRMQTLLLAATALALLQYIGHATLFLRGTPPHGPEEVELIDSMKTRRWRFSGALRSYWDFLFGYGLLVILWGFFEVFLLWQLSALATNPSISIKPLILGLLVTNLAHAFLTFRYFFIVPPIFDLLVAATLALALVVK